MPFRCTLILCVFTFLSPLAAQASTYVPKVASWFGSSDTYFGTGVFFVDGDPDGRSGAGSLSATYRDFGFLCLDGRYCEMGGLRVSTTGNTVSLSTSHDDAGAHLNFSAVANVLDFRGTSITAKFWLSQPVVLFAHWSGFPWGQNPDGPVIPPSRAFYQAILVLDNLIDNKSTHHGTGGPPAGWSGSGPSTLTLSLVVPTPAASLSLLSGVLVLGAAAALRRRKLVRRSA